jgi:hypothetical protein
LELLKALRVDVKSIVIHASVKVYGEKTLGPDPDAENSKIPHDLRDAHPLWHRQIVYGMIPILGG